MTHTVIEKGDIVFLKSLGWGLHLRIKDGQHGIVDQMQGKEILPCRYAFIWHCPDLHKVWVKDEVGHVGVFDLIDKAWVAPVMFTEVFPPPKDNPYFFVVKLGDKKGTYNALTQQLIWDK